jgi:hypothetical protein
LSEAINGIVGYVDDKRILYIYLLERWRLNCEIGSESERRGADGDDIINYPFWFWNAEYKIPYAHEVDDEE